MHDSSLVSGGETGDDLHRQFDRPFGWQSLPGNRGVQSVTLEEFGDDEWLAVVFADVVDGQDIRMVERSRGSRLVFEPAQAVGVAAHRIGQDLDRDVAVEPIVVGAVDQSHTALADFLDDMEV